MTWQPLQLRGISFLSPKEAPALLEFKSGLNVICGATDTGKSFIVESINYLLGSSEPLRDIRARVGYDRARLVLQAANGEAFTLERSTDSGGFREFKGSWLSDTPTVEARKLNQKHQATNTNSLSVYLLSLIDLADKVVQKNLGGSTRSLSFRDLVKLILVEEEDIHKRHSPALTGQYTSSTVEYSIFKLLLTGVDDNALVSSGEVESETVSNSQDGNSRNEFIDELLEELRSELIHFGVNRAEAEEQLSRLEAASDRQQESLNTMQRDLSARMDRRRALSESLSRLSERIDEINSLLERFDLLKEHYQVDVERLMAIVESGSIFVHFEKAPCPLCGTLPKEQHQSEGCDGDVESVVRAATAEMVKVEKLSVELNQTMADLRAEAAQLLKQQQEVKVNFRLINQEIQEIVSPIKGVQESFSDLVKQVSEIKRAIDIFTRIDQLEAKKDTITVEPVDIVIVDANAVDSTQVHISTSVLDDYAQKVQDLLQAWHFPGSSRVHFDKTSKDIVIGGQLRTSRGKGLRAITHAAMTIGLMEFCKERNLSHPGFVVLDSPLLAYYKPESADDSLAGSDLKDRFYNYLAEAHKDNQIIIVENEHPPVELGESIALTVFTKNPNVGRYGFFPWYEQETNGSI